MARIIASPQLTTWLSRLIGDRVGNVTIKRPRLRARPLFALNPKMKALRLCLFPFSAALFLGMASPGRADVPYETMRRLYDFTPIGPDNPVVARVKDCGIEIPVSEFRASVASLLSKEAARALPLAEKRRYLEQLLDDHFLLWNGYEQKADQTESVAGMLKSTQAMLLEEVLEDQVLKQQGKSSLDRETLLKNYRDGLFDKMDIVVANDAYAALKAEVHRLNGTAGAMEVLGKPGTKKDGESVATSAAVSGMQLAQCKLGAITIGDVLQAYNRLPPPQRPDVDQSAGLIAVLRQMLEPNLMVEEARARGLEKSQLVREKMQLNRNVLTRLYALDQLTARAVAQMKSPDIDARLKEWYQANLKKLYTSTDQSGKEQVLPFAANRDRISDDYFEDLQERIRADQIRAWRKQHSVEIDEAVLARAAL